MNGKFLSILDIPEKLREKALFTAISLGSRDIHSLRINLGEHFFRFDVDNYLHESYYQPIYKDITSMSKLSSKLEIAKDKKNKLPLAIPLK